MYFRWMLLVKDMMWIEAKAAMRSTEQSSSTPWKKRSGYAGCALILSELLVLLYLMVAAQLSYDSQANHYHLFIARISLPFLLA